MPSVPAVRCVRPPREKTRLTADSRNYRYPVVRETMTYLLALNAPWFFVLDSDHTLPLKAPLTT